MFMYNIIQYSPYARSIANCLTKGKSKMDVTALELKIAVNFNRVRSKSMQTKINFSMCDQNADKKKAIPRSVAGKPCNA